ncbi:MAG: hypothetical protein M3N53_13060 [Actinomycetota bacterium]|nr:hypothetical protein [Actinomycetota bacterium]
MKRFDECDDEAVAKGCQLTGWWDFPGGGYKHWINKGRQRIRIEKTAKENGDARIERHIDVAADVADQGWRPGILRHGGPPSGGRAEPMHALLTRAPTD